MKRRKGFVLSFAVVLTAILCISGLSLLGLGLQARLTATRTTTEISARAAADAGLTKAFFEMNKSLDVLQYLRSNDIASSLNGVLPTANASFAYTIKEIAGDTEYKITSTGRSGQAQKTVSVTVTRQPGLFDYAVSAQGYARPKHSKKKSHGRHKPPKKGGKIELEHYTLSGYSSDPAINSNGEVQIRTNSKHKSTVRFKKKVTINGDVVVGPGGDPSKVIKMKRDSEITGDTYAAAEKWESSPVVVPTDLDKEVTIGGQTEEYVYEPGKPLSGTVKYTELEIPEGATQEIIGDCTIYVEGDMKLEENATFVVGEGSSLTLYVGEKLEIKKGATQDISGNSAIYVQDDMKLEENGTFVVRENTSGTLSVYGKLEAKKKATQDISGDFTIYVKDHMKLEERAEIIIREDSSLTMYLDKKFEIKRKEGGIINETEDPTKLLIFGTDNCDKIKIENGGEDFYGAVYAPHAKVEIKKSGDLYGAFVGWDVKLKKGEGNDFYYDHALRAIQVPWYNGGGLRFVKSAWREE